jgi:iron complex transport system substrate-binding protein
VILAIDPAFYRAVKTDPLWTPIKAVQDNRVYLVPKLPYGWFDQPPGVNRLMGVRWLGSILFPKQFPENLRDVTRDFYKRFYQVDLSEQQVETLLKSATFSTRE